MLSSLRLPARRQDRMRWLFQCRWPWHTWIAECGVACEAVGEILPDSASWFGKCEGNPQMETKRKLLETVRHPWHSVSIVGNPGACPAAEGLRRKRFLSKDAPPLPVPECSSPGRCKCI